MLLAARGHPPMTVGQFALSFSRFVFLVFGAVYFARSHGGLWLIPRRLTRLPMLLPFAYLWYALILRTDQTPSAGEIIGTALFGTEALYFLLAKPRGAPRIVSEEPKSKTSFGIVVLVALGFLISFIVMAGFLKG